MYICENLMQLREKYIKQIIAKKITVSQVSKTLSVSRQSVHKRVARYKLYWSKWIRQKKSWPKSWAPWNITKENIEEKVIECAYMNPTDWPVNIAWKLQEEYWIQINQSTVYRILKRRWVKYYELKKLKKRKMKMYVKDLPWREVVVYTAIDDCSRYAYWRIYNNREANTTKRFLEEYLSKAPFVVSWIRTDQWMEFSPMITKYLQSKWIKHIRNPWYTPEYNGKVERYHRTWKDKEVIKWTKEMSIEELEYRLNRWLLYYNEKRRHTWLWMNWMTPLQKLIDSLYYISSVNQLLQQYNCCFFISRKLLTYCIKLIYTLINLYYKLILYVINNSRWTRLRKAKI